MIKKLIPLAAGMLLPAMLYAATPTPAPSPTPVRVEVGASDYRVPIGSAVIYGSTNPNSQTGVLVRIKVDSTGRVVVAPTP